MTRGQRGFTRELDLKDVIKNFTNNIQNIISEKQLYN